MNNLLSAIALLILTGCAPTVVQRQAFFPQAENIQNHSTILNNFRSQKFEYYVVRVDGTKVGTVANGSLAVHELLVTPGKHEIELFSSIINSQTVATFNPNWQGKVYCNTEPGKYYVIDTATNGELQKKFQFQISTLPGYIVNVSPRSDLYIACFEFDKKPDNVNLKNKTISSEVIFR